MLVALTRNNLFGREQSASVQGNYGLLEQKVDLIYDNPHLRNSRNFDLTFTGGYANSQDVTTYVASRIEAGFRLTEKVNGSRFALSRANTLIYGYDFRRVKVAEDTLQVFPDFVPVLSAAVRVGGPSLTWLHDSRDNPVDAHRGTYTSFQEFLSEKPFGAEAQFNRIDTTWSSYYGFDKDKFVIARNTRYGNERAFGSGSSELIPLPERLYAGGATSLRSFSINAAGPRDPETGYPIGGAGALVNNTELRLPPTPLPYFGERGQLWCSLKTWATCSPTPAICGRARSAPGSRIAHTCECLTAPSDGTVTPPTAHATSLGPLGNVQLQLLLACAGRRRSLPYAGGAHPPGFQLYPESTHFPRKRQLLAKAPRSPTSMWAKLRTSISSSAWGRTSDARCRHNSSCAILLCRSARRCGRAAARARNRPMSRWCWTALWPW